MFQVIFGLIVLAEVGYQVNIKNELLIFWVKHFWKISKLRILSSKECSWRPYDIATNSLLHIIFRIFVNIHWKIFLKESNQKMARELHFEIFCYFNSLGPVHGGWEEWDILWRPDGLGYCGGQCWWGCLGNPQTPTTQHWPRITGYFILLNNLTFFVVILDWDTLTVFHADMGLCSNSQCL